MLDYLIAGGEYPDFDSRDFVKANIGIKDGKIEFIGNDIPQSREVLKAEGSLVSPGFIDIHMHEENFAEEGEKYVISQMMLKMGVTTCVGGNCGIQRQSIKDFRRVIDKLSGCPVNYMMMAGYNRCRYELGLLRHEAASEDMRRQIGEMLRQELEAGACGISFGIEYDPGIRTEEIIDILNDFEDKGLLAAAHYRSSCTQNVDSIKEMIKIAESIPMKFQISHLSSCCAMGGMKESLRLLGAAMKKNDRLDFDTYPYDAFSTHLGSEVFEPGCLKRWKKDYDCILLTAEPYENVRCTKEIFERARREFPEMLAVVFAMNEEEIREAVSFEGGMIASDGIISCGKGHPRAAGTFPRLLGKYVREEGTLSLIDAIEKITVRPAQRLNLMKKGRIAAGWDADIVVFSPERIRDKATFTDLSPWPEGIEYVFVNGKKAVEGKRVVSDRLGRFITAQKTE